MYNILHNVNQKIYLVLKYFIIILLITMSALVFLQVVFRYCLNQPIAWSEELTTYMFSWLAYIGAAVVLYSDSHIAITTVVDSMKSEKMQKGFQILRQLIILAFFLFVAAISFDLTGRFIILDQRLTNLPQIPIGYIFLQVPISAAVMTLFTVEKVWRILRSEDTSLEGGAAC